MIPFGVFILAIAPRDLGSNWLGGPGDCTFTLPMLLAAGGLWFLIGRYYKNTFGKVTPQTSPGRQVLESTGLGVGLVAVIVIENLWYRAWPGLPVSPIGLALAGLYLFLGVRDRRWYYTVFGGAMGIISLLPLFLGTTVGDPIFGTFGLVFSLVYGVGLVLTGLLDHFRLVRMLRPLDGGSYAGSE